MIQIDDKGNTLHVPDGCAFVREIPKEIALFSGTGYAFYLPDETAASPAQAARFSLNCFSDCPAPIRRLFAMVAEHACVSEFNKTKSAMWLDYANAWHAVAEEAGE